MLEGGAGNDTLEGGAGADVFVFNHEDGQDTVNDFEDGIDRIDVSSYEFTDDALLSLLSGLQVNDQGGVVINFDLSDASDTITLYGVSVGAIDSADFII